MNCQKLRIIYAGTPDFALPALQALLNSDHEIVAVYTQPDRPAGRGRKLRASPVKQFALDNDLAVFQPESLRNEEAQDTLHSLNADVMVVAAYGLILPVKVLQTPKLGCINIHASLLPRWRGAAPIHRAIEVGDKQSGVTIMQMAKGLDTGDMLLKVTAAINVNTTTGELHDQLAALGSEGLLQALEGICLGNIRPEVQDESLVTYAEKITKQEARINWQDTAVNVHRKICAFNPFPVAFTSLDDKALRIWRSELCQEEVPVDAVPGEVLISRDNEIRVATGEGCLCLLQLQLPGKKSLSVNEFLNSRELSGVIFGVEAGS